MVVIFGISSGIGKEIAKSISKDEKVFGTYNSTNNLEDLDMNNIILEKVNLMNIDEIKKYVGQFKNSKERITVLNAAVLNTDSIINNAKIEDLDSSFSLNIKSNFYI
jgi:NADP-dependent 3-hydroxy acid dehydrogenase YdfG